MCVKWTRAKWAYMNAAIEHWYHVIGIVYEVFHERADTANVQEVYS